MTLSTGSLASRAKAKLLHLRERQLSKRDWAARHKAIFARHPEYHRACQSEVEEAHLSMWRRLRPDVNVDTLRICAALSGSASVDIVPEEVFVSEIEPCLNHCRDVAFLGNKSFFARWVPGIFPEVYLHSIEGELLDSKFEPLDAARLGNVLDELPYPVVIKPSLGPGGGRGVAFPRSKAELLAAMALSEDFVVQETVKQHDFLSQFNTHGLNTCRVYSYKSVRTNEVHVLGSALRMGKGGSLDNETAGGIYCPLTEDGRFTVYAVDKWATKFTRHPDTNLEFATVGMMPEYDGLVQLIKGVARQYFRARIVGMDAILDAKSNWRLIEVNLFRHSTRFAQYGGFPFFGQFTEEVIEHCAAHPWQR
jgi:hypothetical protein